MLISINFIDTAGSVALHFECSMEKKTAEFKVVTRNFTKGKYETFGFENFAAAVDCYRMEEAKLTSEAEGVA